jgi:hypothetical protein
MYGNLTQSGELVLAESSVILTVNGEEMRIFNPTHEQYLSAGFFPVRQTDKLPAPAGKRYVDTYAMEDGEIVQSWVLEDWVDPNINTAELYVKLADLEEQLAAAKILLGVE